MGTTARIDELRKLIDSRQDEHPTTQETVDALGDTRALQAALDRYANLREALFKKLAETLDGSDAGGRWEGVVGESRTAMRQAFGEALRDRKTPGTSALAWVTLAALQEEAFYDSLLAARPAATAVDALRVYRAELSQKIDALSAKWEEARRQAEAITRDEATVLSEIKDVMRRAADEQARGHQNRREKLRSWLKVAAQAGGAVPVPEFVKEVLSQADAAADLWGQFAGDVEARKERYARYFREDHTSLLVMFKGAREDARRFLEDHDYTRLALDWTSKARAALAAIRGNARTAGQASDAEALAGELGKRIEDGERAARDPWDRFVRENQTRFFGAFTPDLDAALIKTTQWENVAKELVSLDLQGVLERWIAEDRDTREIDETDMPDGWRPELRQAYLNNLARLIQKEEEVKRENSPDALMAWVSGSARALVERFR